MLHQLRLFAADYGEPIGVWLFVLLAFAFFCATGCGPSPEVAPTQSYKALAAATLATEGDAAPTPTPDIAPSGTCKNCKGTGKVGDGTVFVPCQVCGGDGKLDGEAASAQPSVVVQHYGDLQPGESVALRIPEVILEPTKAAPGCSCGDNCQCRGLQRVQYPHGAYVAKWVWEPKPTAPAKPQASAKKLPPPKSETYEADDCADGQCQTFIPRRGLFRGR